MDGGELARDTDLVLPDDARRFSVGWTVSDAGAEFALNAICAATKLGLLTGG